jgi:hypothetical protein
VRNGIVHVHVMWLSIYMLIFEQFGNVQHEIISMIIRWGKRKSVHYFYNYLREMYIIMCAQLCVQYKEQTSLAHEWFMLVCLFDGEKSLKIPKGQSESD